ncbi:MAG TPA: polysaccharide biosynthesis tyrosine autokinase [Thermoanaerobaculia bacterium]|nr:polysaccharide biosynthesis tyrosine autokinase [Thermoanaerobaculia bacterium]
MDNNLSQEIHLSHYWNIVYKRWKIAAAILLTVLTATWIVSQLSTPLYRSAIVLQVEREHPNRLTIDDIWGIEPSSQEFLQTQYALLRSRGLGERVIDDLRLVSDPDINPEGVAGKSPEQLADLKNRLISQLIGNIDVRPVQYTSLVEVGYVSTSPRLAQKIANGIGESFTTMAIERNHAAVRQASSFLLAQIDQLKQEMGDNEQELQRYKESKEIISLDDAGNITVSKLNELNSAFTAAQNDRIQKEIAYQTLQTSNPESIPIVVSEPVVAQQRAQLGLLQTQYAQKLSTFKPEHPEMMNLRLQIEDTRQAVAEAIRDSLGKARETARTEYLSAMSRERSMSAALDTQKREVMKLNANAVTYMNLQANIDNKRQLLDQLTRRLNETEVTSRLRGADDSNIRFVDRAQLPGGRFNESLTKNMKSAVPLGLVLGLAAVFFLEYLDRSLKTSEEVEQVTRFASLGVIPSLSAISGGYGYGYGYYYGKSRLRPVGSDPDPRHSDIDLLPHTNSRSPISEAYRAFRTALLLASAKSPRVIVITSTSPREGKTTTAVNLAIVLSQMGQPVLIIDADLRKPRLHKLFKSSKPDGLVNHLAIDTPVDQIVQPTFVPNLFFIGSGPIPPNPSELLSSEKMQLLIDSVRSKFAYVILDSPPLLAVTDSVILGSRSDGVVLCIHGGSTPRELVGRAADRLRQSNVPVLGTLLNNLDLRQHGYSYAKHYYEYYEEPAKTTPRRGVFGRARSQKSG